MALIAEYETQLSLLRGALAAVPEVTVEHDDIFFTADGTVKWTFWARGGDHDAFEAALDEDPSVVRARELTDTEERSLYSATMAGDPGEFALRTFLEWDVRVLDTVHTVERSVVTVRCPSREAFAAVREAVVARYDQFHTRGLYHETPPDDGDEEFGVTDPQREALLAALEAGYYEVPRDTTLAAVAERLGVSDQAVSSRLRRGTGTLLCETLARDREP